MSRKRLWLFRLAALLVGVLLAEVTLSTAGMISPRVRYYLTPPWKRVLVPDERLGFRMSPFYPGHDRWGFRNKAVPQRCDTLVIGASMTYGFSASADKAWPRQLEDITSKTAYNMSCGGYGPCEFNVLLDRGLTLEPNTVLIEIFPGNDLSDSYGSVYLEKRFPEYCTQDEKTQTEMDEADKKATLLQLAQESGGQPSLAGRRWGPSSDDSETGNPLQRWLSNKSALYALGREFYPIISGIRYRSLFRDDQDAFDTYENAAARPHRVAFDADPRFRTVFLNPKYSSLAYDLQDPRIREGKRIMESIILEMQQKVQAHKARLVIVLIPSKPVVYRDVAKKHLSGLPAAFFESVDMEEKTTAVIEEFLRNHQVEFINPTAALREGLASGQRLYHDTDDNHLNSDGYRVFAEAIATIFNKTGA